LAHCVFQESVTCDLPLAGTAEPINRPASLGFRQALVQPIGQGHFSKKTESAKVLSARCFAWVAPETEQSLGHMATSATEEETVPPDSLASVLSAA